MKHPLEVACGIALLSMILVGCGDARRQEVAGSVTLDGQPLEAGYIEFRPLPGTSGPTAGAEIVEGYYRVPPHQGTFAGRFAVRILASRPSTPIVRDAETGEPAPGREQYLPARYNEATELEADIQPGGGPYDFQLTSST